MQTDYLVIGSGLAGLAFALSVADSGKVTIITKREPEDSNTWHAQGGIAAAITKGDSPLAHAKDTIISGAGLCDEKAVDVITKAGPSAISQLIAWGMKFTPNGPTEFDLNMEGGHSARRVLHSGDSTGEMIIKTLLKEVKSHPNIEILSDHIAIDIVPSGKFKKSSANRCLGAYVLNKNTKEIFPVSARITMLATGGAGKVYLYTSNPDIASGDGVAMAYRARLPIANMEFVQFHPTCLWHPKAKSFLISEAVRGEGAKLLTIAGSRFMPSYDPRSDLATRDVVARAIDAELKKSGDDHVLLDLTGLGKSKIEEKFPNIMEKCLEFGFDVKKEPIPVVPAAHYFCGGIITDTQGLTDLPALFAAGEVACTGLHGANRLASNSLLEAIVVATRAAAKAKSILKQFDFADIPTWETRGAADSDEEVVITQNWDEIRRVMWNYVGIARTTKRLERALKRLELLEKEIYEYYWDFTVTSNLIELRNLAVVASLVVKSALSRKESRGLHYIADFPKMNDKFKRSTIITRKRTTRR